MELNVVPNNFVGRRSCITLGRFPAGRYSPPFWNRDYDFWMRVNALDLSRCTEQFECFCPLTSRDGSWASPPGVDGFEDPGGFSYPLAGDPGENPARECARQIRSG
jgi:hypothetical protein